MSSLRITQDFNTNIDKLLNTLNAEANAWLCADLLAQQANIDAASQYLATLEPGIDWHDIARNEKIQILGFARRDFTQCMYVWKDVQVPVHIKQQVNRALNPIYPNWIATL